LGGLRGVRWGAGKPRKMGSKMDLFLASGHFGVFLGIFGVKIGYFLGIFGVKIGYFLGIFGVKIGYFWGQNWV
jgi:hypothetical protein